MLRTKRLPRAEVGRVANAAKALIEAHSRRNPTSEFATLGEEGALWELNFQLGEFRRLYISDRDQAVAPKDSDRSGGSDGTGKEPSA